MDGAQDESVGGRESTPTKGEKRNETPGFDIDFDGGGGFRSDRTRSCSAEYARETGRAKVGDQVGEEA